MHKGRRRSVFAGGRGRNALEEKDKYNPVTRAQNVMGIVCKDDLRRYYRFRPAGFYGGIATADCVGCCLKCKFCWSWREVMNPGRYGRFYSPRQVAASLTDIARKKRFHQVRISGNEPTIARDHLLEVLNLVPEDLVFILETNGIMIGHDRSYAEDLARNRNLYIRVSFKGCNEHEFSLLTGAEPGGFGLQLQALENLHRYGANVHPAVMVSFSPSASVAALRRRFRDISKDFEAFEIEELALYRDVGERLKNAKLLDRVECGRGVYI